MKILIYGFRPFKKYKENISEKIIKQLKEKKIIKVILPVVFEKKYILKEIQRHKPNIIIGLGQRKSKGLFEIERKCKNICWNKNKRQKISPTGPAEYFLNLKLKKKPKECKIDYHSGDYVCNFTRYVIMDFIKNKNLKTKFMFMHIPKNCNIRKGANILQKIIFQIKKQD